MRHPKLDPEAAFLYYASLPPEKRSRVAVAEHFECAKSTVGAIMARDRWVERLREMGQAALQKAGERLQETLDEMAARHIEALQMVQQKAIKVLRETDPICFPEALKALTEAIKLERISRGEPDKKTEASLEVVLKNGLEQWLERPGERRGKIRVLNDEGVVDAEFEELGEPAALPAPADDDEGTDDA